MAATKELYQLAKQNQFCADCQTKGTQQVSITLGVFLCLNCSGAHRNLGRDYSQIKSLTLDDWTRKMVFKLKSFGGNTTVNSHYEKTLNENPRATAERPADVTDPEERFRQIRRKYIDKEQTNTKIPIDNNSISKPYENFNKTTIPVRLCDYFLIIERGRLFSNPNKHNTSLFNSKFIPYRSYRYPKIDYKDFPLSHSVEMFVYPHLMKLSPSYQSPQRSAFVLTNEEGLRQYGTCLTFQELLDPMETVSLLKLMYDELKGEKGELYERVREIYSPKSIVVLSQQPFIDSILKFLKLLYRISLSESPLPIERYLSYIMHEVPVPPAGRIQVQCTIADTSVVLQRQPINQLPSVDVRFLTLFECLSPSNILNLFRATLLEQKIVLISSCTPQLIECCEVLLCLIFPFKYQGVYMPILPEKLTDFLDAPIPFLAGIDPSYIENRKNSLSEELVIVDLDTNTIRIPEKLNLPQLPIKPAKKLQQTLRNFGPKIRNENLSFTDNLHDKNGNEESRSYWSQSSLQQPQSSSNFLNGNISASTSNELQPNNPSLAFEPNELKPILDQNSQGSLVDSHNTGNDNSKASTPLLQRSPSVSSRPLLSSTSSKQKSVVFSSNNSSSNNRSHKSPSSNKSIIEDKKSVSNIKSELLLQKEIQKAFSRFFTAIFRNYRSYITEKSEDHFDLDAFLHDEPESSRQFLKALSQTQIQSHFLSERITKTQSPISSQSDKQARHFSSELSPQVRLFDELILQKLNRSVVKRNKNPLPFINDKSLSINKIYLTNPPQISPQASEENEQLFRHARSYTTCFPNTTRSLKQIYKYERFPSSLNPNLFPSTIVPARLFISNSELDYRTRINTITGLFWCVDRMVVCSDDQDSDTHYEALDDKYGV